MQLIIDTDARTLTKTENGKRTVADLYSAGSFEQISREWLKLVWNQKYPYTFTWMGRPVIQLPDDMLRIQEAIYQIKPDVLIETGIAHGGSLVFYAALFKAMGKGRVIGVDIEIRPHNLKALQDHELAPLITLVEGDSTAPDTVHRVKSTLKPGETTLVVLDSCHTKEHVQAELEAYHGLISTGSYIVVTDGIMKDLHDVPRGDAKWMWNNPLAAAEEFLQDHPEFSRAQPAWPFNESELTQGLTHWPGAWLQRR